VTEPPPFSLRPATVADADAMAQGVVGGMEVYRSFAPPGWSPPPATEETDELRRLLADPAVWSLLAERDGRLVGQITVLPAIGHAMPTDDPALSHLRTLFVDPVAWGTGLATSLHAAAVDAMRSRGFARMRLFTPVAQARARRFYEREGWEQAGPEFLAEHLQLMLVEYRRALGS
jgi:GNAT superfamily N-acetyltransferase